MTENEETTNQESGEEAAVAEEQPTTEQVTEEPKAEEAAEEPKVEEAAEEPKAEKAPAKAKAPAKKAAKAAAPAIADLMETIKAMTVLELADLVKALETEFGVSAAAPVAVVAGGGAAAAPAEAEEEKTEFNVILKEIGPNKISVIRAIRELTSLGLKESKDLVEAAPSPVKEGVPKEDAAAAKAKIEEAGATADIT